MQALDTIEPKTKIRNKTQIAQMTETKGAGSLKAAKKNLHIWQLPRGAPDTFLR
jgi:hypothetical protein